LSIICLQDFIIESYSPVLFELDSGTGNSVHMNWDRGLALSVPN